MPSASWTTTWRAEALSPTVSISYHHVDLLNTETGASKASKASFASRVSEAKKREVASKPEWDASTTASKQKKTIEEKVASKIATEVLKDNPKLGSVHSAQSVQKILEREAKR